MSVHFGHAEFAIPAGSTTAIPVVITWDDGVTGRTITGYKLIFRSGATGASAVGNLSYGVGYSDGTRHWATSNFHTDNATSTSSAGRVTNDGVAVECDVTGAATGLLVHTSFGVGDDTFTVTPSDAFILAQHVTVLAVYDTSGQVYLADHLLPTATGADAVTGVPFQPKAMLCTLSGIGTIDAGSTVTTISDGFVDTAGNQAHITHRYIPAVTTNYTHGAINTSLMLSQPTTTIGNALTATMQFGAWTADGFSYTKVVGSNSRRFAALLIGGSSVFKVVTGNAQTSTGTFPLAVVGMTPRAAFFIADNVNAASQTNTVEATQMSFGYCSAQGQWAQTMFVANRETVGAGQETEEYSRGVVDKTMIHFERTAVDTVAAVGEIEFSALDDEEIELEQTDADTVGYLFAALVVGDAFPAGNPLLILNNHL